MSGKIEKLEMIDCNNTINNNNREKNKPDHLQQINKRNMAAPENMQNYHHYPNIMDLQHFIYNSHNEFPNFPQMNLDLKDQKEIDLTMYLFKEFNENLNKK